MCAAKAVVTEYSVTIGMKVPIPNVPYSSCNVEITGKGADWEQVAQDVKEKCYALQEELLTELSNPPEPDAGAVDPNE